MHIRTPITQSPQPSFHSDITVHYCIALRNGQVKVIDTDLNHFHIGSYAYTATRSNLHREAVNVFIDPISAVWMGLVTLEELGLSEQTLAVLKLAMQDVLP